jgi:agmatine deiminase
MAGPDPSEPRWRMPAETGPHERTWMAFPPSASYLTATTTIAEETRAAWSQVALFIAEFEPVSVVVDPADTQAARRHLSGQIDIVEAPLDDAWMRDIGPSFVVDDAGRLGSVEWVFNGWGQQEWATWDHDARIGVAVTRWAASVSVPSSLVNEGGAIQVDGCGTVLVTETVQLDPRRNPGLGKPAVEAELARTIGAEQVIWLPRGLARDAEAFGTRGHVDMVATIPSPGHLLVHAQTDTAHPDHAVMQRVLDVLKRSRDVRGATWEVVELPAPTVLRDKEGWVDYSYVNHFVVNGGVISCSFADPNDDQARGLLREAYPGREVVMVDARPIFAHGGGIHCITQQQPRAGA